MINLAKPCIIYNLFPRLAGTIDQWIAHIERAKQMGFDWIFVNPFHYPGFSGSLYAVKDYYKLNPLFVNPSVNQPPMEQLRNLLDTMNSMNIHAMMDLVINHTAVDSVLAKEHPDWYERNPDGTLKNPSAKDGDKVVVWGDLATIDNKNPKDRDRLWKYWLGLCDYYVKLGFDGFRCDAAYQIPSELWQYLIGETKKKYPRVKFFAESLGCTPQETLKLAKAGFDYVFNSSKWWDFEADWCLEQYRLIAPHCATVSFPESHDTERLMTELKGTSDAVITHYYFAALFSTGVMMPIGFEYGFKKRLNVVETQPGDWEEVSANLFDFIKKANETKMKYKIFQEDSFIDKVVLKANDIAGVKKTSLAKDEEALFVINKSLTENREFGTSDIAQYFSDNKLPQDLSLERTIKIDQPKLHLSLKPGAMKVFYRKVR